MAINNLETYAFLDLLQFSIPVLQCPYRDTQVSERIDKLMNFINSASEHSGTNAKQISCW